VHHPQAAELDAVDAPAATGGEQVTVAAPDASGRRVVRELARVAQLRRGAVPVDAGPTDEPGRPTGEAAAHAAHPISRSQPATMAIGGPGRGLPASLRDRLAPLVGSHAVNAARVHTDAVAAEHAAGRRALAVASGHDIFFAGGHYRPGTPDGDRLIAHEVVHVDQAQRDLLHEPASFLASGTSSAPLERKADQVASQLDQDPGDRETAAVPQAEKRPGTAGGAKPDGPGPAPGAAPGAAATEAEGRGDQDQAPAQGTAPAGAAPAGAAAPALPPGLPLMPEPAMTLSPAEQSRVTGVQHRAHATSKATTVVPAAAANVATARAAVQVPQSESNARKAEQVAADLSAREKPSVEIQALSDRIRELIRKKRPADEDAVLQSLPHELANQAGKGVADGVQRDVNATRNSYASLAASPQGPAAPTPPVIAPIPGAPPAPGIAAAQAVPDAIPADQISLDKDEAGMTAKAHDAGLDQEPAQLVTSGPIADAHAAQGDMKQQAGAGPEEVVKQQQAALEKAGAGLADLQAAAAASLREGRAGHTVGVATQQAAFKGHEEGLRDSLSKQANEKYSQARDKVEPLLRDLPKTAMDLWNARLAQLTSGFNASLQATKDKIKKRHSGFTGAFRRVGDWVGGLPDWVAAEYDAAETKFGDGVADLLLQISSTVNTIIKNANGIIDDARDEIHRIFTTNLPDEQRKWAEQQLKEFDKKLDGLHQKAETTRASFTKDLIQTAGDTVQAAREKVQKLRAEAAGIWGRFLAAVESFLDDPAKFLIEGLLDLVGISPHDFWAVIDKIRGVISDIAWHPIRFADNLMDGVGAGFSLFFEHARSHLVKGLLDWLISGLREAGIDIEVPREITPRSMLGFFLELLGISWARIRKLLVAELGEESVALIEKSVAVIRTLKDKGISGIIDHIVTMLDPKTIIDGIIDAAVTFVTEHLIVAVGKKILLMLNPAGAILAAIEAVYHVLKWIFHNAARIFHLIEAVVNGMADIIAGNTGGVAKLVEDALAALIAPVIDFLADYLGLDDLPGKIAEALKGLQAWVEDGLRAIIKWLVGTGRKALVALGFKGAAGKESTAGKAKAGPAGAGDTAQPSGRAEVGTHVRFQGGGEAHELFIEIAGDYAVVLIHSETTKVTTWLSERSAELSSRGKGDHLDNQKASSLIAEAQQIAAGTSEAATSVAAQAKKTAEEAAKAGHGSTDKDEKAVEQEERSLAVPLKEIADLSEGIAKPIKTSQNRPPLQPGMRVYCKLAFIEQKGGTVVDVVEMNGNWFIKYRPRGARADVSVLARAYYPEATPSGAAHPKATPPIAADPEATPGAVAYRREDAGSVEIILTQQMQEGKASEVHGHPLVWKTYERPNAEPKGWDRLTDKADWDRAHLVNGRLGGPGAIWNLAPVPREVNHPGMFYGHESRLQSEVQKGKLLWMKVTVNYHKDTDKPPIGKASDFPRIITVTYGETEAAGTAWTDKSPLETKEYPVRLPRSDELKPNRRRE
jgi:Domain of unknown function (DUF4157)/DNA/RNA non-specific endonuclease